MLSTLSLRVIKCAILYKLNWRFNWPVTGFYFEGRGLLLRHFLFGSHKFGEFAADSILKESLTDS